LEKGTVVALSETSEGKILIDFRHGTEPLLKAITLKPGSYVGRGIIANYLLGFDILRVEGKNGISLDVRNTVKDAVSRLIGLEIVEEDYTAIVLQCLLEPSSFPPEKILRRAYSIVAGMHRDIANAFLVGDISLAKSVMARDDESNRLYFLLVRILRTIIQNPRLSERLGVSPIECLDYRLAASLVESIGDECVRISQKTIDLRGEKLESEFGKQFLTLHATCFGAHEDALTAFLNGDIDLAEKVRRIHDKVEKEFNSIEEVTRGQSLEAVPRILAVASFLRQIYEHSVDLADLAVPRKT
jgi:phosphate uptake regulator